MLIKSFLYWYGQSLVIGQRIKTISMNIIISLDFDKKMCPTPRGWRTLSQKAKLISGIIYFYFGCWFWNMAEYMQSCFVVRLKISFRIHLTFWVVSLSGFVAKAAVFVKSMLTLTRNRFVRLMPALFTSHAHWSITQTLALRFFIELDIKT